MLVNNAVALKSSAAVYFMLIGQTHFFIGTGYGIINNINK